MDTSIQNDTHTNIKIVLERLLEMGLINEYEYLKAMEKLTKLIL